MAEGSVYRVEARRTKFSLVSGLRAGQFSRDDVGGAQGWEPLNLVAIGRINTAANPAAEEKAQALGQVGLWKG